MARRPRPISPQQRAELEDDPKSLAQLEAAYKRDMDRYWPKPDESYPLAGYEEQRGEHAIFHDAIIKGRTLRFQETPNPAKIQRRQKGGRGRVFSNLSGNEAMRVIAMVTRNPPKFRVPPRGGDDKSRKRAEKQTRWLNQFIPYLERKADEALLRLTVDNMIHDGLGAWEFYLDDSYDDLKDLEEAEGESDKDYDARLRQKLIEAGGGNICVRQVDPLALYFDKEGHEYWIVEYKTPRNAKRDMMRAYGDQTVEEWERREQYRSGRPGDETGGDGDETIECVRWYDERWTAYFVDGKLVGEIEEHKWPAPPIILFEGMVIGDRRKSRKYRGLTHALRTLEEGLDDLLTVELDNHLTYGRPKVAITMPKETPKESIRRNPQTGSPVPLDFEDPDSVPRLEPGELPVDVTQGFQARDTMGSQSTYISLFERSGLNKIATGESPGSDPAGYTVNSLTAGAQNNYEVACDNLGRALGKSGDFVRLAIRDTIGLPMVLDSPMADSKRGATEWLGLAGEDIDETPCIVTIDPLSDVNRLALRQSLMQGNKEGYITRRRVQEQGFGVEDPDAEDQALILEAAQQQLAARVVADVDAAISQAQMVEQAPPTTIFGPDGQPLPPSGAQANGATPAPTQPPTVGGGAAAASQGTAPFQTRPGPSLDSPARNNAGQGGGVRTPAPP